MAWRDLDCLSIMSHPHQAKDVSSRSSSLICAEPKSFLDEKQTDGRSFNTTMRGRYNYVNALQASGPFRVLF